MAPSIERAKWRPGHVRLTRGLTVALALPRWILQTSAGVLAELDTHQLGLDPVSALRVPSGWRRGERARRALQLRAPILQGPRPVRSSAQPPRPRGTLPAAS